MARLDVVLCTGGDWSTNGYGQRSIGRCYVLEGDLMNWYDTGRSMIDMLVLELVSRIFAPSGVITLRQQTPEQQSYLRDTAYGKTLRQEHSMLVIDVHEYGKRSIVCE